jgi:pyridoxamine 5'-phosphate oxidase-like protein
MNEGPGRQVRWQELTKSECFQLLAREHLGRVAVVDDLGPVVFPVNFVLDRPMPLLVWRKAVHGDVALVQSLLSTCIHGLVCPIMCGWGRWPGG